MSGELSARAIFYADQATASAAEFLDLMAAECGGLREGSVDTMFISAAIQRAAEKWGREKAIAGLSDALAVAIRRLAAR